MRVLKWLHDGVMGTDDGMYADVHTRFGRTRVYDTTDAAGATVRVLDVEGTWQSGSYLGRRWAELAFAYHRTIENTVFGCGAPVDRMLMLGGGALSYPKHVVVRHGEVTVDVVEVDRDVTELARRYFFLDRLNAQQAARLRVHHEDGAHFLARHADAGSTCYDVIVNDAFAAYDAPASLITKGAVADVHALLTPGGLYVVNVVAALAEGEGGRLANVTHTLGDTFTHVWVIPLGADEPDVPDNNVVIATDGAYAFTGALTMGRT